MCEISLHLLTQFKAEYPDNPRLLIDLDIADIIGANCIRGFRPPDLRGQTSPNDQKRTDRE